MSLRWSYFSLSRSLSTPRRSRRGRPGRASVHGLRRILLPAVKRHTAVRHCQKNSILYPIAMSVSLEAYPDCVASCITVAIVCVSTRVGGYSPWSFQYDCALLRALAIRMRKSGPIPEYTIPMLGHITATFSSIESSIRIDDDFFSVAMTIPLEATRNMSEQLGRADAIERYITLNTETCCPL